ncbi:hypothetical protein JMJ77_0012160, partial [Colletotrichum scovillei]
MAILEYFLTLTKPGLKILK